MKLIEQFNHDINQSDQTRYERWSSYRTQINSFFEPHLKEKKENLLIVGAGHCDDIDLSFLKHYFENITLSDIDLKGMMQGILNQGFATDDFSLLQTDYTGFESSGFFDTLVDDLILLSSEKEIETYLNNKFELNSKYQFMDSNKGLYDAIIVLPIYTQLIYNQILNATLVLKEMEHSKDFINLIQELSLQNMTIIIDQFNQNIFKLLDDQGLLFVFSDIFQSQIDESFYLQVERHIHSKDLMDKLYTSYRDTHGYGLGDYGIYSISSILKSKDHQWFIWPFEKNLHMIVQALYLTKK